MPEYTHIVHPFGPLYDKDSHTLILGSLPSVASRGQNFFYGHPQNRFWPLIAALFHRPVPETIAQKRALCLEHGIALWDVIGECDIRLSADGTIRNVTPNDLTPIFQAARITRVFCNGKTAGRYYERAHAPCCGIRATVLPSTSPANAAYTMERLIEAWRVIAN